MKILNWARTMAVVAAALLAAVPAAAETIRAEGGSSGSLTALVPQLMSKYVGPMGHDIRVNVDQTLTRSTLKVATGAIDLTTTPAGAFHAMKRGVGPYADMSDQAVAASENVRALFAFLGGHIHAMVFEDSDVQSFDDIKGKRVFVGPPSGQLASQSIDLIRTITGYEPGEDYEAIKLDFSAANQAFADGKFEVFMRSGTIGSAAIDQIGAARKFRIIGVPEEAVGTPEWEEYLRVPGRAADPVRAGTYSNQVNNDADQLLAAYVMMMTVNSTMSDELAYDLTRAMFDNIEDAHGVSSGLKPLTLETALQNLSAPLHPGAMRYFEEKGVEIPDSARPAN